MNWTAVGQIGQPELMVTAGWLEVFAALLQSVGACCSSPACWLATPPNFEGRLKSFNDLHSTILPEFQALTDPVESEVIVVIIL
jgi:hypothetical protein